MMPTRDTPWAPGTPCWVDLMTTDEAAARDFYAALFDWSYDIGGPDAGGYSIAKRDGRDVAGVMGMMGQQHPPVWTTYLATADADVTARAVEAAGGKTVLPPSDAMDVGRVAVFQSADGAVFGVWQARRRTGFELANEPGSVVWNEQLTRDYATARDFYTAVFGYETTLLSENPPYATIEVDGSTVGGLGTLPPDLPADVPAHWRVYFSVEDTDATVEQAVALGGSVLRPAADMPYGRHADLADPQGAAFSVIMPTPMN